MRSAEFGLRNQSNEPGAGTPRRVPVRNPHSEFHTPRYLPLGRGRSASLFLPRSRAPPHPVSTPHTTTASTTHRIRRTADRTASPQEKHKADRSHGRPWRSIRMSAYLLPVLGLAPLLLPPPQPTTPNTPTARTRATRIRFIVALLGKVATQPKRREVSTGIQGQPERDFPSNPGDDSGRYPGRRRFTTHSAAVTSVAHSGGTGDRCLHPRPYRYKRPRLIPEKNPNRAQSGEIPGFSPRLIGVLPADVVSREERIAASEESRE